ncbi:MAG: DNA polymerase III subunit delta [Coxiellaceae bacterium]|nr:DNA polymerase III subunit delta [Coxiellaceae bacterium]
MSNSFYFIHGASELLVSEERLRIINKAKANGFDNVQRFSVEAHFDWNAVIAECQSMDLWADKKIIDLDNHANRLDRNATAALTELCQLTNKELILIIRCSKLTGAQTKAKWYEQLESDGNCINVRSPALYELPTWLVQRAKKLNLQLSSQASQLLAELTQGNLLASHQALEKCVLLGFQQVEAEQLRSVISNSAKYTVFDLSDALLQNTQQRRQQILQGLQQQSTEATLVLWSVAQACRQLFQMKFQVEQGVSLQQATSKQWSSKRPLYQAALKRTSLKQLNHMLQQCHLLDETIKSSRSAQIWQQLSHLCLQF